MAVSSSVLEIIWLYNKSEIVQAKVLREWVGLRPGRGSVRLETETLQLPGRRQPLPVVHNYGHGGAGLTLAWGCAGDAVGFAAGLLQSQRARAKL